jgi:hypothetical protein
MVSALTDDLKNTKKDGISQIDTKPLKKTEKTKLRNCLTPAFGYHIEESMPEGTSNKDGCIYFIIIISRNFLDKEAHKHIIRDNTMELKTQNPTQWNLINNVGSRTHDRVQAETRPVKQIADSAIFNHSSGKSVSIFPRGSRGPGKTLKNRSLLHLTSKG